MAQATDTYGTALKLDVFVYEGTFTRRDVVRDDGTIKKGGTFSAQLALGDFVQIWTDSFGGAEDIIVAKQDRDNAIPTASGFSGALGYLITAPAGKVPDVSADGGIFTATNKSGLRNASVVFPGFTAVVKAKIADASKAGAFLGWDSSAAAFTTNSVSVSYRPYVLAVSASAGGSASVLLGGGQ